jgi:hypothetical protein
MGQPTTSDPPPSANTSTSAGCVRYQAFRTPMV